MGDVGFITAIKLNELEVELTIHPFILFKLYKKSNIILKNK